MLPTPLSVFNSKSLSKTLALTAFSLSAIILALTSAMGIYLGSQNQQQAIAGQQKLIAQGAAGTVQSFVQGKSSILQTAVKLNYIAGITQTNKLTTLQELLSTEPSFNRVALLDTNQKQVAQASRLPNLESDKVTASINPGPLFQTTKKNQIYISPVYIDKATSEPLIVVAVPIDNVYTGFSGVLAGEVNLKFMWDLVAKIQVGEHGQAYVVDARGKLIAARDTSRVLKHENVSNLREVKEFVAAHDSSREGGRDRSVGISSGHVVSTYAALGTPNWAVVTEMPTSEADAPVARSLYFSLAIVALGLIITIVGSIMLARWISRPIVVLKNAAAKLGQGDLTAKIENISNNEIGELGRAFNVMAASLQTSTAKLQEEHLKLEASINSLRAGFLMIDLEGGVVINQAARKILAYSQGGRMAMVDTKKVWTLQSLDEALGPQVGFQTVLKKALGNATSIEQKAVDYNSRILRIFIAPIFGRPGDYRALLGTVVLIEDITEERIVDRSKDEFFSIASHELRTPLTAIKGNSRMILDYYAEDIKDETLKEMLQDIHTSSVRLIEIVNDFLDVSRLEQGKMSFKPEAFVLDKVIEQVIYEMGVVLQEKKLYLNHSHKTLDQLPLVWADPNKVKQIIYNLIGNAAKFTDQGGISVNIKSTDKRIKVTVSDTGRGMTPESQALLFHKFQQAGDSLLTRDTTRGTGLGLYISKMFAEKMNGQIKLESSAVGKGSVFSFTLPIATPDQIASATKLAEDETQPK